MILDTIKLRTRFIILFAGVMAFSLFVYFIWSNVTQQKQAENEMREKAYVLSQQLDSVWEFMSINQDLINHDSDGAYNFKGLHCSLVGKSIGALFGEKTGYKIRYVNHNPRNKSDIPDDYESSAIDRFKANRQMTELYGLTEYKGEQVFRYVVPMTIDATCLECHGEPAGELDVLKYPKEGWKIGDLAGVLSIIMPTDICMMSKKHNIIHEVAFFSSLMLMFVLIVYFATTKLVTMPLKKLTSATEELKKGNMLTKVDVDDIKAQGEIRTLTLHFADMIEELRNVYSDLENKVQLRTHDLAEANNILENQQAQLEEINKRLQKDNEYKSEFLAIMSHELRTPLTSIIAFAELLGDPSMSDAERLRTMTEIINNSRVLLSLINNTLDMARLEAGTMVLNLEQVDLVDIVNEVEAVIQPIANKKRLTFSAVVDDNVPVIDADHEKLHRIIENLLSNAVKFSKEGGMIDLSVSYDSQSRLIIIKVKDNGIGIGRGHLNLIFDKFVQGDSSIRRPYNGSGLGLALSREYAELHGGKILVESELGMGSLFTVIIPANISKEYEDEDITG